MLPKIEPGSICPQFVRCGRKNCHCASGELHGPYFYRFWREDGRLRKKYVKQADAEPLLAAQAAERRRKSEIHTSLELCRRLQDLLRGMETQG